MFDFTRKEMEMLNKEDLIKLVLSQQKLLRESVKMLDDTISVLKKVKEVL